MIYLFVITFAILLVNLMVWLTMFGKRLFAPPFYKQLDPTVWWLFYPSLLFQVWFWVDRLMVI